MKAFGNKSVWNCSACWSLCHLIIPAVMTTTGPQGDLIPGTLESKWVIFKYRSQYVLYWFSEGSSTFQTIIISHLTEPERCTCMNCYFYTGLSWCKRYITSLSGPLSTLSTTYFTFIPLETPELNSWTWNINTKPENAPMQFAYLIPSVNVLTNEMELFILSV